MSDKFLIIGDVHIGKGISIGKPAVGSKYNSRVLDQFRLLGWILSEAKKYDVKSLIFTGDIFHDTKPDYRLVILFFKFLKRCERLGLNIYIVAGNHDIKRVGSLYFSILDIISTIEFPLVKVYKNIETIRYNDNLSITFLPFRDRTGLDCKTNSEALDLIKNNIEKEASLVQTNYSILIGHIAMEGAIYVGDEFDNLFNELHCPVEYFSKYDCSILGHVHKPQVKNVSPLICHIGSLDLSDFGETDHVKEIYLFDSSTISFSKIQVPTRPLREIELDIPIDTNATRYVKEQIEAMQKTKPFNDSIVRIKLKFLDVNSELSDRKVIEGLLYKLGAFYICNYFESQYSVVVPISKQKDVDNTIDPKSAVTLYADKVETFDDDKEMEDFIQLCNDIIDEYTAKVQK